MTALRLPTPWLIGALMTAAPMATGAADAHGLRERGQAVAIAKSPVTVTPPRDWNRLDGRPGKFAETWTLDGEQLNDVTFYTGVESGEPLVRERNRKREPLPKFRSTTLLAEVPELLEGTYRAARGVATFTVTTAQPGSFLGKPGIRFTYAYTDADELPRMGEARAVLIGGKLYMATFDAPRLYYFDRFVGDYRALADSAALGS